MYLVDKRVDVALLAKFSAVLVLPWCLKPLYGLISDSLPLFGERRRPYIVAANTLNALLWSYMAVNGLDVPQTTAMSLFFCASLLTCFADVMYDSLLVVVAASERDHGMAQTTCWVARAAGALLTAFSSGALLTALGFRGLFALQATLHLVVAVAAPWMLWPEQCANRGGAVCATWKSVRAAFAQRDIYLPAMFIFFFGATPSSGTAMFYFFVERLHFSTTTLGVLGGVTHAAMLIGTLVYRRYLRGARLRGYFFCMVVLSSALGATPLVLVNGYNRAVGLPDALFVGGDDLFMGVARVVMGMPLLILVAKVCPKGVEASVYATFVSVMNFSGFVSEYGGGVVADALGVTRSNFDALSVMVVLCTLSTLLALCFVRFLPDDNISTIVARRAEPRRRKDEADTFAEAARKLTESIVDEKCFTL